MASSTVQIVNTALVRIGQKVIAALDQDNERAEAANAIYETVRDELLANHPWNCIVRRTQLAEHEDTPAFGWSHQHVLPSDFLTLLHLDENEAFSIESYKTSGGEEFRMLLANSTPLDIVYTARVTDPTRWDMLLTNCISLRLSAELAQALHGEASMVDRMWKLYEAALSQAAFVDSKQSWSRNILAPLSHLKARRAVTRYPPHGISTPGQPI